MSPAIDPVLGFVLRGGLALLFLSAAAHKIRHPGAFRAALANYALLPRGWVEPAATVLVALEVLVGAGLVLSAPVAPLAALVLAVYSAAIAINLWRGRRDIDCGCAGPAGRVALGGGVLLRNAALIVAACLAALPSTGRELLWLDALTATAGVVVAALVYTACETALANASWGRPVPAAAKWSGA